MIIEIFSNKVADFLATLVLVCLLLLGGTSIYKTIAADGRVTHCYVEAGGGLPVYRIVGYRSWRSDVTVGIEKTGEEAHAKMKELCP